MGGDEATVRRFIECGEGFKFLEDLDPGVENYLSCSIGIRQFPVLDLGNNKVVGGEAALTLEANGLTVSAYGLKAEKGFPTPQIEGQLTFLKNQWSDGYLRGGVGCNFGDSNLVFNIGTRKDSAYWRSIFGLSYDNYSNREHFWTSYRTYLELGAHSMLMPKPEDRSDKNFSMDGMSPEENPNSTTEQTRIVQFSLLLSSKICVGKRRDKGGLYSCVQAVVDTNPPADREDLQVKVNVGIDF